MSAITKPRILIIEDNPGDVYLFRVALSEAGLDCEISGINDGAAALAFVRDKNSILPDLIVLDLNLPKVNGKEILGKIRETQTFQGIPIVIWTSSWAQVDQKQVEQLGASRYLVKPPQFSDLASLGTAIKELLEAASGSQTTA